MITEFHTKTPIVFGWGAADDLGPYLPDGECFLVLGSDGERRKAAMERVSKVVKGKVHVFGGVEPNPTVGTVDRGASALDDSGADFVLAMGGGSVIDAAKAISVVASCGGSILDHLHSRAGTPRMDRPLIAVPTTPGTSSEITPFSVVTSVVDRNKLGLRHPALYPNLAVIDPALTLTLGPHQTAATGLDILSHAFESYWSAKATPITRQLSLTAVSLISGDLENAFNQGSARSPRENLSLASVFAGMSFSRTGTTICHAFSYPITFDTGLSHGMACAISLPGSFEVIRRKEPHLAAKLAEAFGSDAQSLSRDLKGLLGRVGAPTSLEGIGFKGGLARLLETDAVLLRRSLPFEVTDEDLLSVFHEMSGR